MPIKGGYLFIAGAGGLLVWSGLTGKSWSSVFRDILTGQNPSTLTAAYTIRPGTPPTSGGTGTGGGISIGGKGSGNNIPCLGTTLPPQSTMDKYFGPIVSLSHETTITFAGHRVVINRAIAGNLQQAGKAIEKAGLAHEIRDVGGFRTAVGASGAPIPFSMHQYGAAIDINEDGGPNGNWHTMTLDPRLVAIMRQYRWFCGENWGGASRDGGHFQFMGNC